MKKFIDSDDPDLPVIGLEDEYPPGFTDVSHVLHGFEGELDEQFHRSTINGWRFSGLPWEQM